MMNKPIKLKYFILSSIGMCMLALSFSCGRTNIYTDQNQLAITAVNTFRSRMNDQEFQSIYSEADPTLKNSVGQEAVVSALTRAHQNTGKVIKSVQVDVSTLPNGQIRLVYNTKFEKGDMTELFVLKIDEQNARLVLYQVFPNIVKPDDIPK
jgi:hypothetical protein